MADVAIDTRDLRNFARAMRTVSRKSGRAFHDALKASAKIIADEARPMADSDKVAATIKPGAIGAAAYVQIGSKDVPEAVLREVGNASRDRDMLRSARTGKFKHPVFGVWTSPPVEQDMHPAVGPAVLANQKRALDELLKGVNKTFESVHLEMD